MNGGSGVSIGGVKIVRACYILSLVHHRERPNH